MPTSASKTRVIEHMQRRSTFVSDHLSWRPQGRHPQELPQAPPPDIAAVAAPACRTTDTHGAAVFDVATKPATEAAAHCVGGYHVAAATENSNTAPASVWSRLRSSLSRSEAPQAPKGSRRSISSRGTHSRSRRRCNGSPAPPVKPSGRCPCCGAKENHVQHPGQERNLVRDTALCLVCPTCQRKRELAAWIKLGDWKMNIREVNFLSLQKHYKFELPNQADSAAFSLHNGEEERIFFAVSHTMEARSSHLPDGWEMKLYVPNPAVDKDILNVVDERSIDAFLIVHAVRPSGHSFLSYFSREPLVLWEHWPTAGGGSGEVKACDRRRVLAYIYYTRTPFMVLRVENSQHRKMLEICRIRKGSKRRRMAQEWVVYTANREVAIAKILLFLDECKSIAGRDATIHFEKHLESNVKVLIVVSLCYIQYVCFGRCSGADI